jgi:E3 ubiquitin-protein ligase MYCBP2
MTLALRKAACRAFAMQALNWLLRSVSQPACLHDLLWCFVAALEANSEEIGANVESKEPTAKDKKNKKKNGQVVFLE